MINWRKIILLFSLINITIANSQEWPPPNCDFKLQNINRVSYAFGNIGDSDPSYVGVGGFSYDLNYPKGSNNSWLAHKGFWLGTIMDGDTLCSASGAYENENGTIHEFYPDFNAADTVYRSSIFEKRDPNIDPNRVTNFFGQDGTLDQDYYPISQKDLICQYYDYKITKTTPEAPTALILHEPIKAHVIERTYAWDNEWYQDIIFFDKYIINESQSDWENIYFGIWTGLHVGDYEKGIDITDDICYWDEKGQMLVQGDHIGTGGDDIEELICLLVLGFSDPNTGENVQNLKTTAEGWAGEKINTPITNNEYYRFISRNEINRTNDPDFYGSMKGMIAKGPAERLESGDTLRITSALVGGNNLKDLRKNVKDARSLYKSDFKMPMAPNPPKFILEARNNAVKIDWHWKDSYKGYRPINSKDESRNDGILYDFDGFKVYRSVEGPSGPWTLVAQYDSINGHGYDSGLEYDFIDSGLKNGLKYWYSVTSFDIRDDSSRIGPMESPITYKVESTMPGPKPEYQKSDQVYVVPNPYRADINYSQNPAWEKPTQELRDEWYEIDRRIVFMNLPGKCEIKIFTINGIFVNKIEHDRTKKGHNIASWNLLNKNNHTVGSGIYYFTVIGGKGFKNYKQVGKFVIVK